MSHKKNHVHKESEGKVTVEHKVIQDWIEKRGGKPSIAADTIETKGNEKLLVNFEDKNENAEEVTWDTYFEIFEDNDLAFLYQEKTIDGNTSRFYKFIDREEFYNFKK